MLDIFLLTLEANSVSNMETSRQLMYEAIRIPMAI